MTKRTIATILIIVLLLPVVSAGGVLFAQKSEFEKFDASRENSISESLFYPFEATGERNELSTEDDRYIVKFKDETPLYVIESALDKTDYRLLAESESRLAVVVNSDDFLNKYKDIIDYSEPDLIRETLALTDDAVTLPAYESLGIHSAWDIAVGKSDVIVAVLDTGVEREHEDLSDVNILHGYDAVGRTSGVNDDSAGHGTGVIGIIAATANNKKGVAGVAHGVTILPVKVTSSSTAIYSSDLISGIRFAADAGAKIINMSVGGYSSSYAEQEAVNYAVSKGCILISAAGNGGNRPYADQKSYPASYDGVISVASCDENGERSEFSQYNDSVDVAAIGEAVTMPYFENGASVYRTDSGTSFSCAIVSGIAALAASNIDDGVRFGGDEFLSLIIETCGSDRSIEFGHGIINAYNIVGKVNEPIITGVFDGGVYSESVRVRFNRGTALLNGDPFSDGDSIIKNGKHTLTVTDGENAKRVTFKLDYNPLSFEFHEFAAFSYFSFERGSALLDGFPYQSEEHIVSSGKHEFVLFDGDEIVRKDIYLQYSLPEVFGVEDGMKYDKPILLRIVGDGNATLDGKTVYGAVTVSSNGSHTLIVTSGNDGVTKTYEFEIDFPYGDFIKNDYAYSISATDEENGYFCLYGDSLVGVRIYSFDSPEKYLHFLPVGRVYSHVFTENELLLFSDNGITVLNRENIKSGNNVIDRVIKNDGIDLYFGTENTIFGFNATSMHTIDLTSEEATLVTRLGFKTEKVFFDNGKLYLLSSDALYSYNIENSDIDKLFDISTDNKSIALGSGYITVGNRLIDLENGEIVLEFAANNGVKIQNGLLFTERSIIDLETKRTIGTFEFDISDIAFGDNGVYLFGVDNDFAFIKNGADGVAVFGAAENFDKAFSAFDEANGYRKTMFYDHYTQPVSVASGNDNLFVLFGDKFELYSVSLEDLSENQPIPLDFEPKNVFASNGRVIVTFKNAPYLYVADESDVANGNYIKHDAVCDSAFALGERIYFVSNGRLNYISGNNITKTAINADKAILHNENIYVLSGNRLSLYNRNHNLVSSVTAQSGNILVGNGIAVGNIIFDYDLNEETARLNQPILAFSGNTVITKQGVFDLKTNQYIGKTGVNTVESAIICADNSLFSFGKGLISICSFGNGYEITDTPQISGIEEGGIYVGGVNIEYDGGIGYLDGTPFESGDSVSAAGAHIFKIALPCGRNISINFTVEANIERIEFLVGDRAMSVGETVTLRIRFLPDGASSVPVKFSCDSDGLQIGEMGDITALAVGEYIVKANVETEYGSFETTCTITVRDDLIVFNEDSGVTIDRDNGFILGVDAGTTVSELLGKLASSGETFVVTDDGKIVTEYVATNHKLILQNGGETTDSLTIVIAGDTDGDGFITAYDLFTLERILRGESYESAFLAAADANKNGITADNDYRDLKNSLLYLVEAKLGTPNKNLFGLSTIQTQSRVESGSIIDVVVCISGCKYTRGISGVINFSEGLEFVEGVSTGWQTDYRELDNRVSFYAFGNDGQACGKAFKLLINLRFRVTAEAGKTVGFSSDGLTAATADDCSIIRCETTELFVYEQQKGAFKIDFLNAQDFEFDASKREYDVLIPYNNALADISVTSEDGQTVTISNPVIPDSGKNTVTITLTESNGKSKVYTIEVTRDKEPRFDTNCYLSTLEVEGFRLTPQFSPEILSYNLTVPYGTEKINVYCTAQNKTAAVIIGDTTIKGEETKVTITVGAPDGETLKYVINVFMLPRTDESINDSTQSNDDDVEKSHFTLYAVIVAVVLAVVFVSLYVYFAKRDEELQKEAHTDNTK